MIRVHLIETRYPAPEDDGADYCPDPVCTDEEVRDGRTFRELVRLMQEHSRPSCYPPRGETFEWCSAEPYQQMDGETVERSLHYARDQYGRHARFWRLAMIAAGIVPRAQALPPLFWWTESLGRIELQLTEADARSVSHSGDCGADVDALGAVPYVRAQLASIDPETVRASLREYGAWDAEELADHAENLRRLLWIAGGDIAEEINAAE